METGQRYNRIAAAVAQGNVPARRSAMSRMVMPGQALACLTARTGRGDFFMVD